MALTRFDTTLEYSPQVLEFTVFDEFGVPRDLGSDTATFTINRIDELGSYKAKDTECIVSDITIDSNTIANSFIKVTVDMSVDTDCYKAIHKNGDADYSFEDPVWEHTYSIVVGSNTIIAGRLNMVKV